MVPSVYFSFFCLLVSSVSNFCPDTRGRWWSHFLGSLVQSCCGEGATLQTNITGVCGECLQCLGHTGFAPAEGVYAFPVYTAQAPGYSAGELSKAGPGLHFPGLSLSGSSSPVLHKGADWVGPAFYAVPQSQPLGFRARPSPACPNVSCVSSGELISGCNPPGGCQPSRISGSLWLETGSLFAVW